jgi:hypothetical protein
MIFNFFLLIFRPNFVHFLVVAELVEKGLVHIAALPRRMMKGQTYGRLGSYAASCLPA